MKKIILAVLICAALLSATLSVYGVSLGHGASSIASGVTLVKSGLLGEIMEFCDTDFKAALGVSDFGAITVRSLPSSAEGTLMIGQRRVSEGARIARRDISELHFIPNGSEIRESGFYFSLDRGSEERIFCRMRFLDKINYEPTIKPEENRAWPVITQSEISVFGRITAEDPEGDMLEYTVIRYPKYGILEMDGTGGYVYTPVSKRSGYDSFTVTVRDEYGNYSEPKTVDIKIIERMSEVVFADMQKNPSCNAAVSMEALGIMSGSRLGDDIYFDPEGEVMRAEFVAMAMKAVGIRADTTLTETFFDDNASIPPSLVSYVATAARLGIVNGAFEKDGLNFRPKDAITRTEAAIIMSNLTELSCEYEVFSEIAGIDTVPVWARPSVGAMYECGIFEGEGDMSSPLSRGEVAEYLYRLILHRGKIG